MYRSDRLKQIILEKEFVGTPIHNRLLANMDSSSSITVVDSIKDVKHLTSGKDPFDKTTLIVSHFHGKFLSSCPGSDGMVCCRYYVINTGPGCLYDCHYCFLQSFVNTPYINIYGNTEDILAELQTSIDKSKFHMRIGTGEYADSLALENLTGLAETLIHFFADQTRATLELKTKSSNVDSLLNLNHKGNTVIAWSMNPQKIIDAVEDGTSSLDERLEAAARAVKAGYKVAFHFDPMIYIEDWESEYHAVLDKIAAEVDPWSISWISLGTFRHSPGLKEIIQMRFSDDNLTRAEMIQGSDGKLRYMKTIREEMYRSMKEKINSVHPDLFSYMCMETKPMWNKLEGEAPDSAGNLDRRFDERRQRMEAFRKNGKI